ncbi:MAG: methyltransferase domain-containing protein [Candidatus Marsarchaeota archaeon]|jgi:tRNA (adenine57-N1/adenine58-N1)-methyltransferase|nr:methyltransferase domain-containing protein [Candidatus Marsarchaeota archaeon]MCL5418863.1 methyltransferase domain-containing protein [Candidatus Marsarchaeota archaeon]
MFMPKFYRGLKRGPQVILPKDIGAIIAYTGISKDSVCVDAGTGSGWLAIELARLTSHVTTYEIRPEFAKIAQSNISRLGLGNIDIRMADISKGIKERAVDLVTLDMPGSEKVVRHAYKALKPDGYICSYLPHMEQVKLFVKKLEWYKFHDILVIEVIVRDMLVREAGMRPSTKGVWHTAYLAFAQK